MAYLPTTHGTISTGNSNSTLNQVGYSSRSNTAVDDTYNTITLDSGAVTDIFTNRVIEIVGGRVSQFGVVGSYVTESQLATITTNIEEKWSDLVFMKLHISFPPFQTKDIVNLRDNATPYQLKKWIKKRYGRIISDAIWSKGCTIITSDDLALKQFKDIGIKELDYLYLIPSKYETIANQLLEMGFNIKHILPVLKQTDGSLERTLCILTS